MMVGYTHNSTTRWRIWDPNFQVVQAQSDVIFDEERNAYVSCTTDGIDIFDCQKLQNTSRNFRLEMDFTPCNTLETEMDFSEHRTLE